MDFKMAVPADQRNFRSFYYEKLCVRGVEEKKSIEILFKEKPLDVDKLSEFCLRFPMTAAHRPLVWKLILGVLPPFQDCHEFVSKHRDEHYVDLQRSLVTTRRVTEHTPKPDQFLRMFLIDEGRLKMNNDMQFVGVEALQFLSIASVFHRILSSDLPDSDMYWLTVSFFKITRGIAEKSHALQELFFQLVAKEDAPLCEHLQQMGALERLPVRAWFGCCFAGTLHDSSIGRIWDKVIGGSNKILAYVASYVVTSTKESLLAVRTLDDLSAMTFRLTEEVSDVVTSQALEAWKEQGESRRATN